MRALFGNRRNELGISNRTFPDPPAHPTSPAQGPTQVQPPLLTSSVPPLDVHTAARHGTGIGDGTGEPESRVWPSPRPMQYNRAGIGSGVEMGMAGGRVGVGVVPPTPSAGLFIATPRVAHRVDMHGVVGPVLLTTPSPDAASAQGNDIPHFPTDREHTQLSTLSPKYVHSAHSPSASTSTSPYPSHLPLSTHLPISTHLPLSTHLPVITRPSPVSPSPRSPRSPRATWTTHLPRPSHTGPRQPLSPPRERLANSGQVAARIKRYSVNLVDAPASHRAVWNYGLGREHYRPSVAAAAPAAAGGRVSGGGGGGGGGSASGGRGAGDLALGSGIGAGREGGVNGVNGAQGLESRDEPVVGSSPGIATRGETPDLVVGSAPVQRGPSRRGAGGGVVPMMPKLLAPLSPGYRPTDQASLETRAREDGAADGGGARAGSGVMPGAAGAVSPRTTGQRSPYSTDGSCPVGQCSPWATEQGQHRYPYTLASHLPRDTPMTASDNATRDMLPHVRHDPDPIFATSTNHPIGKHMATQKPPPPVAPMQVTSYALAQNESRVEPNACTAVDVSSALRPFPYTRNGYSGAVPQPQTGDYHGHASAATQAHVPPAQRDSCQPTDRTDGGTWRGRPIRPGAVEASWNSGPGQRPLPVPVPLPRPFTAILRAPPYYTDYRDYPGPHAVYTANVIQTDRNWAHWGGDAGQVEMTPIAHQAVYSRPLPIPQQHTTHTDFPLPCYPLSTVTSPQLVQSSHPAAAPPAPPAPTSSYPQTVTLTPIATPPFVPHQPTGPSAPTAPTAPPPMDRTASRPGGPRPLGLSRTNTKLPVASTYRGVPVGRLSPPRSRAFLASSDALQRSVGGHANGRLAQHSGDSANGSGGSVGGGGSGAAPTLSRRAAISRHSNQSYLSAASAYTTRTYSSSGNVQHRLSLVSAISASVDEYGGGVTGEYGDSYGLGCGHDDGDAGQTDMKRGAGLATFVQDGQLTDSPPQQSDNGRGARAELEPYDVAPAGMGGTSGASHLGSSRRVSAWSSASRHPFFNSTTSPDPSHQTSHAANSITLAPERTRTNTAISDITLEWQPDSLQQHYHLDSSGAAVRNAWQDMERKLGRRVNSALDAERGEWVVRRVQRQLEYGDDGAFGVGQLDVDVEVDVGEERRWGGDQGSDREAGVMRSPGEFSISDYLHFDAQTPLVNFDRAGRAKTDTLFSSATPVPGSLTYPAAAPAGAPTPQSAVPSPHVHIDAQAALLIPRPLLEVDTRICSPSTSTPPMSVQSGTELLQSLERPIMPPLRKIEAHRLVPAVSAAVPDARVVSVGGTAMRSAPDTRAEVGTSAKLERTRTGRSRHLALGTSSVRVKHGNAGHHVERHRPVEAVRTPRTEGGHMDTERNTTYRSPGHGTRSPTLDSAVYAPSAHTSAHPSDRDRGYDLSEYYHMDDSLFPVSLSPIDVGTDHVAKPAGAESDHGVVNRRRTGDGSASPFATSPAVGDVTGKGDERTLRIWREKTQRHHRRRSGIGQGGISSVDYLDPSSASTPAQGKDQNAVRGEGEEIVTRSKRTRDGLTRLDTQIVHAMRAFKSRAVSPFASGSASSAASPDAQEAQALVLESDGSAGGKEAGARRESADANSEDGESQISGRRMSTMARWGQQALSRVVSRSRSRRSRRDAHSKGGAGKGEGEEREVVLLDTPRMPSLYSTSHGDGECRMGGPSAGGFLRPPHSPVSPVLITPPTQTRALPVSPPQQQGLGLGVPIGLRSTYSLYNRPADLTLMNDNLPADAGELANPQMVKRNKPLPIPAALMPAPHISPYSPSYYTTTRQLPMPPANASPYPCSPIWPDAELDAAQMLRVKDLDTGHACEVAMSRVEQALAAISR